MKGSAFEVMVKLQGRCLKILYWKEIYIQSVVDSPDMKDNFNKYFNPLTNLSNIVHHHRT